MIYPKGNKNHNLNSPYTPPMNRDYSVTSDSETATINRTIVESETSTTDTKHVQLPQQIVVLLVVHMI